MIRILHTSDLHFGAEDSDALAWFQKEAAAAQPDAVLVTGDLTQRAKRREFAAAARWLKQLPAPVIVEPGNHDLPYFNLYERFVNPYARVERVEAEVETQPDLDGVSIVSLPTTARFQFRLNWSLGHVSRDDLARAVRGTKSASARGVTLVACHHPLIDKAGTDTSGSTRRGAQALRQLAAAGADAILSGHVHTPYDLEHEIAGHRIRLIGAGTLSERIREHPPSYNEIVVENGDIRVLHHVES